MVKWKKYLAAAVILFLLGGQAAPFSGFAEAAEQIVIEEEGQESEEALDSVLPELPQDQDAYQPESAQKPGDEPVDELFAEEEKAAAGTEESEPPEFAPQMGAQDDETEGSFPEETGGEDAQDQSFPEETSEGGSQDQSFPEETGGEDAQDQSFPEETSEGDAQDQSFYEENFEEDTQDLPDPEDNSEADTQDQSFPVDIGAGDISDQFPTGDTTEQEYANEEDYFLPEDDIEEIVDDGGSAAYDNDDAFAAYVNREMNLTGDLASDTGSLDEEEIISEPRRKSSYASNSLRGANLTLYNKLKEEIRRIATGERASTAFSFTLEELSTGELQVNSMSWTAEQLGLDSIVTSDNKISAAASSAAKAIIEEQYGINIVLLHKTLLADCPYDLYWYNKTNSEEKPGGLRYGLFTKSQDGSTLFFNGPITLRFYVASDYAGSEDFTVNTEIGTSVSTARETAEAIVSENQDLPDYWKLDAYREQILALTSYNYNAVNNTSTPYGNPWQLIHVFDGDPDTNVVCEGYSKAFQYLCDLSSFSGNFRECLSVSGKINGSGHMWNLVLLKDGRNYLVDLTNCDSSMVGAGDNGRNLFLAGVQGEDCEDTFLAEGDAGQGYTFYFNSRGFRYKYDSEMFSCFSTSDLTLAEGRIRMVPVTGVALEETELAMLKGQSQPLSASVQPENAADQQILWTSDDESVATVTEAGVVEAVGNGTATIIATSNHMGFQASCPVSVTTAVEGVSLNTNSLDLYPDETAALEAVVTPSDASNQAVTWSSSNPDVASVSSDGSITALTYGSAMISVTTEDGGITETCEVTVFRDLSDATVTGIIQKSYTGTEITQKPVVIVDGKTLTEGTDYSISYEKNLYPGDARLTISGEGVYTGSVTIGFEIVKAAQTIIVRDASSSLPAGRITLAAGRTTAVSISGAKGELSFHSSDPEIADIDSDLPDLNTCTCTVSAKKVGTATITVSSAETANYIAAQQTFSITVVPAAVPSFKAVNCVSTILLKWSKTAGADSYLLYRNGVKIKTITDGNTLTFTDTGATTNGAEYVYKIVAKAPTGTSTLSKSVTIYRLARPGITSLTNQPATKNVLLKWGSNARASGYQIQYSLNKDFSPAESVQSVTVSGASSTSKVIKNLEKGKVCYFRIRTFKTVDAAKHYSAWSSSKSVKITALPAEVPSFKAVNCVSSILLKWTEAAGADGYLIYRNGVKIKTITGGNTLTFTDTTATANGTRYVYEIFSKASEGTSTLSKSVTIYRLARPEITSLTNQEVSKVLIKWKNNAKASGYQIQYSLNKDFSPVESVQSVTVNGASSVSRVIANLKKGKTVYFRMRVFKTVDTKKYYSSWSTIRSVKISR